MLLSPCGLSSMVPKTAHPYIRCLRQFMKVSNVKSSSRIPVISYSASTFLILERFNLHNEVILFTVIDNVLI